MKLLVQLIYFDHFFDDKQIYQQNETIVISVI